MALSQSTLHPGVRIVTVKDGFDLITLQLDILQWLSIAFRLKIKMLFWCLQGYQMSWVGASRVMLLYHPTSPLHPHNPSISTTLHALSCHRTFAHTVSDFFPCALSFTPLMQHLLASHLMLIDTDLFDQVNSLLTHSLKAP